MVHVINNVALVLGCIALCLLTWLFEVNVNASARALVTGVLLQVSIWCGMTLFDANRTAISWRRGPAWWLRLV